MPEKGLLTRTYSARDQVPGCPVFTSAKNKLPRWDKYFIPRHNICIYLLYLSVSVLHIIMIFTYFLKQFSDGLMSRGATGSDKKLDNNR